MPLRTPYQGCGPGWPWGFSHLGVCQPRGLAGVARSLLLCRRSQPRDDEVGRTRRARTDGKEETSGYDKTPIVAVVASYPGGGSSVCDGKGYFVHKLPPRLHCDCVVGSSTVLASSSRNAIPHPIPSHPITSRSAYTGVMLSPAREGCLCVFLHRFQTSRAWVRHILKSRPCQSPSTPPCSGPDDPPIYGAFLVVHPSAFSPPWPLSSAQLHTGPGPRVEHRAETYRTVQPTSRMPGVRGCRPNWTTVYHSPLPFPPLLSLLSSPSPSLLSSPKIVFS